jgi:adenosylcobyric acid synthase
VQLEDINVPRRPGTRAKIVVPQLARIANFDDFDPLREEPEIELVFVPPGRPLPRDAALIVIPGTKSTIADMELVRSQGWDVDILSHVRHGGRVLGICGGYQMLGRSISDPNGIEGPARTVPGLGLLDVETVMTGDKTLREVAGVLAAHARAADSLRPGVAGTDSPVGSAGADLAGAVFAGAGAAGLSAGFPADVSAGVVGAAGMAGAGSAAERPPFAGYEMHVGHTTGPGAARPFLRFSDGSTDGAVSADGRIAGCYVHGLFGVTEARAALVAAIGAAPSLDDHNSRVDAALDDIAAELEQCLDVAALAAIAGLKT